MQAASVSIIKKELQNRSDKELIELCMRLAKYKKENKELLSYLLFEAHEEESYIQGVKRDIELQFAEMNQSTVFFAKKTIRKVLRFTNKHIKYSGSKQTEVELLLFYCITLKNSGISLRRHAVLENLYQRQVQKIEKALANLHEDLQYDYQKELDQL